MITNQDILERAREWQLRPEVVEKDYVLGWLLAAVGLHEDVATTWVLKGGTCVKKCFFETYRFSEDLDFSLLPDADYSEESISETLRELTELTTELSGIEFNPDALSVRARPDKLGRITYEGKIGYKVRSPSLAGRAFCSISLSTSRSWTSRCCARFCIHIPTAPYPRMRSSRRTR